MNLLLRRNKNLTYAARNDSACAWRFRVHQVSHQKRVNSRPASRRMNFGTGDKAERVSHVLMMPNAEVRGDAPPYGAASLSTDGLGVAVPPAPTFAGTEK